MPELRTRKGKYVFLCLRFAVIAIGVIWAAFWISREQRWANLTTIFRKMNMGIFVLTLSIFIFCQVVIGFRWWVLLRVQSIYISLWAAVKLYFLGWFYNNFMPSSVGGDLVRAWYVTRHTDKRFEAVLSVFADRAIGLLSTLIIAAFFYSLFLSGQGEKINLTGKGHSFTFLAQHKWMILYVFLVVAVVFCVLVVYPRTRAILIKIWSSLCHHSWATVVKLKITMAVYCNKPLTLFIAFILTVGAQIVVITGFWILGVNMGIDAGIKYYYVFFTLMWVVAALPVSIGGAVVMEGGLAYLFVQFAGVEPEAALALALSQRVVWMVASVPGAMVHLIGAHLPKDFFIDSNERIA
ncbi:lysylphosphatidylglycerol synthase transmembrane domain-containing protein [Planctomycetota bacterium]